VSDRTDLRSPDVDGRMDSPSAGTLFACPRATRLQVSFDPRGTVALVGAGRPLVYGAVGSRAVNRRCEAQGNLSAAPTGALEERTAPARLTCTVRGSARFVVRPIDGGARAVGSVIAVLAPNLHSVVLSTVLEPTGSRLYYGRACRTR
jgi:hypothetical protein